MFAHTKPTTARCSRMLLHLSLRLEQHLMCKIDANMHVLYVYMKTHVPFIEASRSEDMCSCIGLGTSVWQVVLCARFWHASTRCVLPRDPAWHHHLPETRMASASSWNLSQSLRECASALNCIERNASAYVFSMSKSGWVDAALHTSVCCVRACGLNVHGSCTQCAVRHKQSRYRRWAQTCTVAYTHIHTHTHTHMRKDTHTHTYIYA